jgi:hypothetical protein
MPKSPTYDSYSDQNVAPGETSRRGWRPRTLMTVPPRVKKMFCVLMSRCKTLRSWTCFMARQICTNPADPQNSAPVTREAAATAAAPAPAVAGGQQRQLWSDGAARGWEQGRRPRSSQFRITSSLSGRPLCFLSRACKSPSSASSICRHRQQRRRLEGCELCHDRCRSTDRVPQCTACRPR